MILKKAKLKKEWWLKIQMEWHIRLKYKSVATPLKQWWTGSILY